MIDTLVVDEEDSLLTVWLGPKGGLQVSFYGREGLALNMALGPEITAAAARYLRREDGPAVLQTRISSGRLYVFIAGAVLSLYRSDVGKAIFRFHGKAPSGASSVGWVRLSGEQEVLLLELCDRSTRGRDVAPREGGQ